MLLPPTCFLVGMVFSWWASVAFVSNVLWICGSSSRLASSDHNTIPQEVLGNISWDLDVFLGRKLLCFATRFLVWEIWRRQESVITCTGKPGRIGKITYLIQCNCWCPKSLPDQFLSFFRVGQMSSFSNFTIIQIWLFQILMTVFTVQCFVWRRFFFSGIVLLTDSFEQWERFDCL